MRPKIIVPILLLALASAIWLRPKHATTISQQSPETVRTNNQSSSAVISSHQAGSNASLTVVPSTNSSTPVANHPNITEALERFVESRNKPIDFYGRFIDQASNPMPGVKITINVEQAAMPAGQFQGYVDQKYIPIVKTSDADGRFEIHDERGDNIGFGAITNDGYLLSPNAPRGFGGSAGTFENPIIFNMWKLGEKAQLVSGSKFWGIIPDGRVYTVDLLQQKKIEGDNAQGDVKISIVRPVQIRPRTKFDWSFSIEAINGGLIEADDDFLYLAPESGYQPSYQITMSATNTNWKKELHGLQFYLKSRDGQIYGSLKFDLIPDYNDVSIFNVRWSVNPNGSRNLQP